MLKSENTQDLNPENELHAKWFIVLGLIITMHQAEHFFLKKQNQQQETLWNICQLPATSARAVIYKSSLFNKTKPRVAGPAGGPHLAGTSAER
jgi:hypothetical protein